MPRVKFYDDKDKRLFLLEIGKNPESEDTDRDHSIFIKKRKPLVKELKNFTRQQDAKSGWNRRRGRYVHGIRRFARSTSGRRLHKRLSRFLQTHDSNSAYNEAIQAASIIYEQLSYYHPIEEQVALEMLWEDLLHLASKSKIQESQSSHPVQCPFCDVWFINVKRYKKHNCAQKEEN